MGFFLSPRGLPVNGQGYARGGPQTADDSLSALPDAPTTHYLYSEGGPAALRILVKGTSGVLNAFDTEVIATGPGTYSSIVQNYVVTVLAGTGAITNIDGQYVDDQYGPNYGDYLTVQQASVDRVRGIFVEGQDNAKALKAYGVHVSQSNEPRPGSPVGATRWAFIQTADAPSYFGGPLAIISGQSAIDLDPPALPTFQSGDAFVGGAYNSHRNIVVKDTGDVVINDSARGTIKKSPNGHYWRETVDNAGARVVTDLGTTPP